MTYNVEYQCLVGSCPTFHKLTVGRVGSGIVTSSPIGIDCGTDCAERYFVGTVVTLTSTPGASSAFDGWGGNPDCADGVVTITAEISCVATFVRSPGAPLLTLDKTSLALWGGDDRHGVRVADGRAGRAADAERERDGDVDGDVEPAVAAGEPGVGERVGQSVGQRGRGRWVAAVGQCHWRPITLTFDGRVEHARAHRGHADPHPGRDVGRVRSASWTRRCDNTTGVTGAIPFTGWALDDIEVTRVMICRAAFGAKWRPSDPELRRARRRSSSGSRCSSTAHGRTWRPPIPRIP